MALVIGVVGVGTRLLDDDPSTRSGDRAEAVTRPGAAERTAGRRDPVYEYGNEPSPIVLRLAERDLDLRPWTYCWSGPVRPDGTSVGACADGIPAEVADLPDVGHPDSVPFWFGMGGWEFEASFRQLGVECPHSFTVDAEATADHTFRLDPAGPAGRYQVDLSGNGAAGDVITSFVWTTPADGPVEQPAATIAVVSDDDDSPTGLVAYGGLELYVSDLAATPDRARARVVVTAANGRSMPLDATREARGSECGDAGSLWFRGSDADAQAVTRLGPAPFTYEVRLDLDGQRYDGTAVWPRDEDEDQAPLATLRFDPPLPTYAGD